MPCWGSVADSLGVQLEPTTEAILRAKAIIAEAERRERYKFLQYFPDCQPGCLRFSTDPKDHVSTVPGRPPICRVLYTKSMQFIAAGVQHRERLYLAANRIGKTDTAGYEVTAHMTGQYPKWWHGRKFDRPTKWWAAGDTMLTTRDILQVCLMGPHEAVKTDGPWTGMIPAHLVSGITRKSGGVVNCLDTIYVEHVERVHGAPAISSLQFKSYDQGRRVFQGTEMDGIWLDEEPPDGQERAEAEAQGSSDIYTECLLRTMTSNGILIATFTPLRGMTPFLVQYLESAVMPGTEGDEVSAKAHFYPGILDGETPTEPEPIDGRDSRGDHTAGG